MATYKYISKVNVGSGGAANIEFTNIPQTYTDLMLVASLKSNDGSRTRTWTNIQFNNTTANRKWQNLYNQTSTSAGSIDTTMRWTGTGANGGSTSSLFSCSTLYIGSYTRANAKPSVGESATEFNGTITDSMGLDGNLWSDTSAITSIKLLPGDGSAWLQHSNAYLYGISNA